MNNSMKTFRHLLDELRHSLDFYDSKFREYLYEFTRDCSQKGQIKELI